MRFRSRRYWALVSLCPRAGVRPAPARSDPRGPVFAASPPRAVLGIVGLCLAAAASSRSASTGSSSTSARATEELGRRLLYTVGLMFDIGSSLREARLRQDLDFPELEERTKIRPKYLRAFEDERFDILPAPTYIRGFLRSYADCPRPRRPAVRRRVQHALRGRRGRRTHARPPRTGSAP